MALSTMELHTILTILCAEFLLLFLKIHAVLLLSLDIPVIIEHVQRQVNRGTKNALKDRKLPHMQASKVCFWLKFSHTFPCFLGTSVACAAGPSVNRTIQLLQV
jgi:hypothetical protein